MHGVGNGLSHGRLRRCLGWQWAGALAKSERLRRARPKCVPILRSIHLRPVKPPAPRVEVQFAFVEDVFALDNGREEALKGRGFTVCTSFERRSEERRVGKEGTPPWPA